MEKNDFCRSQQNQNCSLRHHHSIFPLQANWSCTKVRDSSGCLVTANPDHCTLQKASSKSCTHKLSPVKGFSLCHRLQTLQVIPQALTKTNRTLAHPFHLQQVTLVGLEVRHDLSKGKTKGIWSHNSKTQGRPAFGVEYLGPNDPRANFMSVSKFIAEKYCTESLTSLANGRAAICSIMAANKKHRRSPNG